MRNLYVIACGAKPAADIHELVQLAIDASWDVYVGTTPSGWDFIDELRLRDLTGHEVRHTYSGRTSGWPPADAVIVAPATINTIDKFAAGIADTWALSTLIELYGHGAHIVFAPNVNPALGRHPRFRQNITELRTWGISVPWEDPRFDDPTWMVPWETMLSELNQKLQPGEQ